MEWWGWLVLVLVLALAFVVTPPLSPSPPVLLARLNLAPTSPPPSLQLGVACFTYSRKTPDVK